MNTKTIALRGFGKEVGLAIVTLSLVFASFFAVSVPQAQAAALTEPQIQAILNLLSAFNVPAATIANVNAILHKSK